MRDTMFHKVSSENVKPLKTFRFETFFTSTYC